MFCIVKYKKDGIMYKEKLYKRYDLQDESDFQIETLQQIKAWLQDFWIFNPDEDWDNDGEDCESFCKEIFNANEEELFEMVAGIGYCFDKIN